MSLSILLDFFVGAPIAEENPVAVAEESSLYAAIAAGLVVSTTTLIFGAIFLKRRWPSIFDAACKSAFAATDVDKSGRIEKEELYSGVLELYLLLHAYGIMCYAPKRAIVDQLYDDADSDLSGGLDYLEFNQILAVLSEQTLGRAMTQLAFTALCPLIAGMVCAAISEAVDTVVLPLPSVFAGLVGHLPDGIGSMMLSTFLMLSMHPALSKIDSMAEKRNRAKTAHVPGAQVTTRPPPTTISSAVGKTIKSSWVETLTSCLGAGGPVDKNVASRTGSGVMLRPAATSVSATARADMLWQKAEQSRSQADHRSYELLVS